MTVLMLPALSALMTIGCTEGKSCEEIAARADTLVNSVETKSCSIDAHCQYVYGSINCIGCFSAFVHADDAPKFHRGLQRIQDEDCTVDNGAECAGASTVQYLCTDFRTGACIDGTCRFAPMPWDEPATPAEN